MPYRIERLRVKNFKCFNNQKYYSFSFDKILTPIILSGPNGFGKTTFFDAIELIFTKNITRLNYEIEDGRTKLGKNILLNEADYDGVLVLDLKESKNKIKTIITTIDRSNQKLNTDGSIKYCVIDELLNSDEEIESFLQKENKWEQNLSDCGTLNYLAEHFNIYYYVSQAESVHFLKRSIKDRKSSVNTLLNTDNIENNINYIENSLIGKNKNKGDVIINSAIEKSEKIINEKANLIKSKLKEINWSLKDTKYEQLLNYDDKTSPFSWDTENITFDSESAKYNLDKIIKKINALHHFMKNKSDYEKYLKNKEIEKLIKNKEGIADFFKYYSFIENDTINSIAIYERSVLNSKKVEVYKSSDFFRKEFDVSIFKDKDLMKIKQIDDKLISSDIKDISKHVKKIVDLKERLSENLKLLNKLKLAREELHNYKNALNDDGRCPFCDHRFNNNAELEKAFQNLSNQISEGEDEDLKCNEKLFQELKIKLKDDYQRVLKYIQDLDDGIIRDLNLSVIQDRQFIKNTERVKVVEKIYGYISSNDLSNLLNENEKSLALESYLQEKVMPYTNQDFVSNCEQYDYQKIANEYKNILFINQDKLIKEECVDRKVNYIKYKYILSKNSEIEKHKIELKNEIEKKYKLNSMREGFNALKAIYKESVEDYKNQVIKKLRIPLLIYTGKILQDYQNGLGVFISKDEMRFVSNGDAKHDILNTFSSGQLSGFVLAFLFAMNKQYITMSEDNLGFILVDDPVQTMDDINVASLIEVLRNDFAEKQIILSTHETDKENYILYKFLKYNLKGQSFNVKEKLYL
jgi:exonuclease SbcC